jgi:hypothetical protein
MLILEKYFISLLGSSHYIDQISQELKILMKRGSLSTTKEILQTGDTKNIKLAF